MICHPSFLTFSSRQRQGTQTRTKRVKYGDGNRDKQLKWLIVSAVITDSRQVTHQINKYNKAPKKTDHWQELRASADSCAQSDEPIIRLPATAEKRRPAVRMTARHLRRRSRGIIKHAAMLLVVIYATASSFWVVHRGRPRGCMLKQVRDWLIYTRAHISTGGINKRTGAHTSGKSRCVTSAWHWKLLEETEQPRECVSVRRTHSHNFAFVNASRYKHETCCFIVLQSGVFITAFTVLQLHCIQHHQLLKEYGHQIFSIIFNSLSTTHLQPYKHHIQI